MVVIEDADAIRVERADRGIGNALEEQRCVPLCVR